MQDFAPETPCSVTLPNRGLIRIGGTDRHTFLQGFISNDITLLDSRPLLYACLLTAQGKFQHDFFVSKQDDALLLECEGGSRTEELFATLKKFRLRSNVTLEPVVNHTTYISFSEKKHGIPDPRHPALGQRCNTPPDAPEAEFRIWDRHRIALGIPDGSRDMIPGQSTLLECNIDRLNGISFSKGCYLGQELTARMHYRGLAKKHLIPVRTLNGAPVPPPGMDIKDSAGHLIGEMRSGCGDLGLALVKDDAIDLLAETGLEPFSGSHPL